MKFLSALGLFFLLACSQEVPPGDYVARYAEVAPVIDGKGNDACWTRVSWAPIDQRWLGDPYTEADFSGRYKAVWDEDYLYILCEIIDDTLIDIHPDDLVSYWNDDCVEIFIDEDHSGGDHQYNHNAFAYHIGLDYQVVDIGPDSAAHYYNHVKTRRTRDGNTYTWEFAISLYDDSYQDGEANTPVKLYEGKEIGFAIAYCDNDYSEERENFIGSVEIEGEDKDRGWIDAGVFGTMYLKK